MIYIIAIFVFGEVGPYILLQNILCSIKVVIYGKSRKLYHNCGGLNENSSHRLMSMNVSIV